VDGVAPVVVPPQAGPGPGPTHVRVLGHHLDVVKDQRTVKPVAEHQEGHQRGERPERQSQPRALPVPLDLPQPVDPLGHDAFSSMGRPLLLLLLDDQRYGVWLLLFLLLLSLVGVRWRRLVLANLLASCRLLLNNSHEEEPR